MRKALLILFLMIHFAEPKANSSFYIAYIYTVNGICCTLAQPQQDISYEEWLNGLGLCYQRRPYKDDLASRLISRLPEYNSRYIDDLVKTTTVKLIMI